MASTIFPTGMPSKSNPVTSDILLGADSANGNAATQFPISGLSTLFGGITSISVATANGFAGSSSSGNTPTITLTTPITGILKGNGTAISAATSGTDYGTVSSVSITSAHGFNGSVLNSTSTPQISISTNITGMLKADGLSMSAAIAGTDYLAPSAIGTTVQGYNANTTTLGNTTTGSGSVVLATSPTLVTPALGTPSSGNLSNCTFPTLNQNTTGTAALATNIAGGSANQINYQTGAGTSGFIGASANSVLVTNGSSVPSLSTTLPSGLSATNLSLTTPTLGVATATSINGTLIPTGTATANVSTRTINAQSGTTYTFVLGDAINTVVTFGSASANTITVPTNASVAFPIGSQIDCVQVGAGKVTFSAAGGVTISSQSSNLSIAAQYVGVSLVKTGTNTWLLLGNLSA